MRVSFRPELLVIFSLLVFGALSIAQQTFFPEKGLSDDSWSDRFRAKWYSQELEVLGEPSLLGLAKNRSESSRSNQFSPNLAEFALVLEVAAPTNPQLGENVREMELNGTLLDT